MRQDEPNRLYSELGQAPLVPAIALTDPWASPKCQRVYNETCTRTLIEAPMKINPGENMQIPDLWEQRKERWREGGREKWGAWGLEFKLKSISPLSYPLLSRG